jgi:limonene-1,2-epoxide hydrolase
MTNADPAAMEQHHIDLVTQFCQAWETADIAQVLAFVDDAIFYQMWDDDAAIKVEGKAAFEQVVGGFLAGMDSVEFDISRTQCIGKIVINERVDRFVSARGEMVFPVTGVFVVEDGKVVYWKDYLFPGKVMTLPF